MNCGTVRLVKRVLELLLTAGRVNVRLQLVSQMSMLDNCISFGTSFRTTNLDPPYYTQDSDVECELLVIRTEHRFLFPHGAPGLLPRHEHCGAGVKSRWHSNQMARRNFSSSLRSIFLYDPL